MKNEINLLAVAVTACNSADSFEALIERLPDHKESLQDAVVALRALSYATAGDWLDSHDIEDEE